MTLSVPISAGGRARGFLNLDNFRVDDAFGPEAIEVAEALAVQVGLAFQRLRLEASLREERARYQHLADHDPLTDLPNRRLFQDRLEQALTRAARRATRVGLVYVDLDDFKRVNDAYGHAAGDELLREVAHRLSETVRAEDTVARLGGDEFAVVLAEIAGPGDARAVDAKLHEAMEAPFELKDGSLRLRASIGHAVHPDDGRDADTLMRAADAAMYRSKDPPRPEKGSA
jgi:diguanylate cyclase (GGDEF)-like protein